MSLPDPSLEPAVRDPKKLRNTALFLIAVMLLGGILILIAYNKVAKKQAADDRPAKVYRITPERDLRMLRQDGEVVDLLSLRQKVFVVNVLSLRDPQPAARSLEVMKRLAADRAGNPDFHLVTLILDPQPADTLKDTLARTAAENGMTLPQWWVGSNIPDVLHKFIYNQLKASLYPVEKNGRWEYDGSLVVIDKSGNIRRGVVPQKRGGPSYVATFDFDQAAAWDAKNVKTVPEGEGVNRTNTDQLEHLLNHTIDQLLAEPLEN